MGWYSSSPEEMNLFQKNFYSLTTQIGFRYEITGKFKRFKHSHFKAQKGLLGLWKFLK